MLVFPVNRVLFHVSQAVIHPTHIPFEVESQSAGIGRMADSGPGCGFFGNGKNPREFFKENPVQLPDEGDGFQVFPTTIMVGQPFSGFPVVIQVKH